MKFSEISSLKDLTKQNSFKNTKEMKDFYDKRTAKHISLVQKYCKKIHDYDPTKFKGIIERGQEHDQSKYKDPEYDPYVMITWDYRCKDLGEDPGFSKEDRDYMNTASEHHVHNNRHHPEFHSNTEGNTINRDDRDAIPDVMVDATKMTFLDVAELCADWAAMSDEKGDNNPQEWAKNNVNKRWKFSEDQESLIYELLDEITKK